MDDKTSSYNAQKSKENIEKLRKILKELPSYSKDYFRAKETTTSIRTRVSYAYDLRVFYQFLQNSNPAIKKQELKEFTLYDLNQLTSSNIEEYQEYLKLYQTDNGQQTNSESGIARKISSLRSFMNYFYKKQLLDSNPSMLVDIPKIHDKAIIHLEPDEIAILLDNVESYGTTISGHNRAYYEKTKLRDLALITLLLGTGIRVSECAGLDLNDINFRDNSLRIIRKGDNEEILYFGEEVEKALRNYINGARTMIHALTGHENVLFYSMQKRRMSVAAIEDIVKKYAGKSIPQKRITPHKLRSSFGTTLYQETGDIYLVADVLGHKDVNTTRKQYAAINESRRKIAASVVKLRE